MKRKGIFSTSNVYAYVALKLLWLLLALFASQVFFYCYNSRIFHLEGSEWLGFIYGNLRFGLATVTAVGLVFALMMILPFPWRRKGWWMTIAEVFLIVPALIALIANIVDGAYFQFTYRRISSEILLYLTIGGDMNSLIPKFVVDYWPATATGLVLFLLLGLFERQTVLTEKHEFHHSTIAELTSSAIALLVFFVLLRGGFGSSIQLSDAARVVSIQNSALVTNSPYTFLRTVYNPDTFPKDQMSDQEALAISNPLFSVVPQNSIPETVDPTLQDESISVLESNRKRMNVVVIVLESFSQEYMGCYNSKGESFTPFLDSLAKKSQVFDGRSNGKKSIEAIPAIFASLPTLMEAPFSLCRYKDNDIKGLPQVLNENGYQTAFFHGSYNGSMAFDKFCKKAGFQQYFGMDEYVWRRGKKAFDGTWGIFDEPFLQYTVGELSQMKEPFMGGIFTISSHHPYTIPQEHEGQFKTGSHPLLQTVHYGDYALQQFFATASREPWYNNTLFVILADHPGQGLTPQYNGLNGSYRIPMIFYSPRWESDSLATTKHHPIHSQRIVQQTDVMPTILDFLQIPCRDLVCFGHSALDSNPGYQVFYGNGFHCLVVQDKDQPEQNRVAAIEGKTTIGNEEDINLLRAIIHNYHSRMEQNALVTNPKSKK